MLFKEIIAVYSEKYKKRIPDFLWVNVELIMFKCKREASLQTVATLLYRVNTGKAYESTTQWFSSTTVQNLYFV
jgi:hypothetical protein